MKTIVWTCDKCGETVAEGLTLIEVKTGAMRRDHPELSLCPRCADLVVELVRSGAPELPKLVAS